MQLASQLCCQGVAPPHSETFKGWRGAPRYPLNSPLSAREWLGGQREGCESGWEARVKKGEGMVERMSRNEEEKKEMEWEVQSWSKGGPRGCVG